MRVSSSLLPVLLLIPSVVALATDSNRGGSASSSSSSSGSRKNGDTLGGTSRYSTSVASTNDEIKQPRIRKSPGAPHVDSTLLRFVSEQKKQQEQLMLGMGQQQEEDTDSSSDIIKNTEQSNKSILDDETVSSSSATTKIDDSSDVTSKTQTKAVVGESILPSIEMNVPSSPTDPWMGQFNRNRIAQRLTSLGASKELAIKAGTKVQNYVLVRMTRRHIRTFLRERDSLWNNNYYENSDDEKDVNKLQLLTAKNALGSPMPHPTYGFDEIVEVMLKFGLTGIDIGTILTHSPNVALMMPDPSYREYNDDDKKTSTSNVASGDDDDGNDDYFDEVNLDVDTLQSGDVYDTSDGETLEETLNRSLCDLLLNTLGMRKYEARKILRGCPGLLSVRGSKAAIQVVTMMLRLGASASSIERDKNNLPLLLSRSPAGIFRLISFLSSDPIRMPIEKIGPLIRRTVSRELLDAVTPVPRLQPKPGTKKFYVEEQPNFESKRTREEKIAHIDAVYRNMTKTAIMLRTQIGTQDLGKAVSGYPSILLLDAKTKVLPTASYLINRLGIPGGDLASVLQLYPTLLKHDIQSMEVVVCYMLYLGVKREDLGGIFRAFPKLLTMKVSDMEAVVEYLLLIGVQDVGLFVTRLPPILGYSVENDLKPKWEFLRKVCLQPLFELTKFPGYFSYPLSRIKLRYDYLAARAVPAWRLIPADAVLSNGDVDFATQIARDTDGGKVFLKFMEKRGIRPTKKRRLSKPLRPPQNNNRMGGYSASRRSLRKGRW